MELAWTEDSRFKYCKKILGGLELKQSALAFGGKLPASTATEEFSDNTPTANTWATANALKLQEIYGRVGTQSAAVSAGG